MGKPEYAAPELALGDIQHQNQTTDIYAMGILLYQCIVGHTPFEGARHEILDKQLKAKLPLDVIQNKDLKAIIAKACEKKQELRFQTSAQMRVALENPKSMQGGLSRQKKIGIAIAVVALVIVLGIAGIVAKNKQDAAKAEAEKALFEKQKTQFMSTLNSKLDKADQEASEGMDSENTTYEQSLMSAYIAYKEAADLLNKDKTFKVKVDVASRQQKVLEALKKAQQTLSEQAKMLGEMGEEESAGLAEERARKVETFLNSIK